MRPSRDEAFDAKWIPEPNSGCWLWMADCVKGGYGRFFSSEEKRKILAHRFSYQRAFGPIPDGVLVCHKCDTPSCVNPDHLFLGSDLTNSIDMSAKGRGKKSKVGRPYGVWPQKNGRYYARITFQKIKRYFGTYDTAEEASAVATAARDRLWNEWRASCGSTR